MSFNRGIKKLGKAITELFGALVELLSIPLEFLDEQKFKRRQELEGKYTVSIPKSSVNPKLVAYIYFHAERNSHDIKLITYENQNDDIWDELPDNAKSYVNGTINSFLYDLMKKHNALPYTAF